MARFPAWVRKTMWRKMSAAAQQNACEAMIAVRDGSGVAAARGIPPEPAWIKGAPGRDRDADVELLFRRVRRRLLREESARVQRVAAKIRLQSTCTHPNWSEGKSTRLCLVCGLIANVA